MAVAGNDPFQRDAGVVDEKTMRVVLASNSPGATAAASQQYTDDDAAPAHPKGDVTILVRQDTPTGNTSTDGDAIAQRGTNFGAAYVTLLDASGNPLAGVADVQYVEDAVAAVNPTATAVNLIRQDTPSALVSADGDNVAQRGTNFGAAYVTLLDSSGNPLSGVADVQYVDDAVATAHPTGNAVNLIRKDTPAALTSADGDNVSQRGTNYGAAYVTILDGSGNLAAASGTSSAFGAAIPASGTAAGFSDGTNMQAAKVFDVDTGVGTSFVLGAVLRKSASGGSVEAGTATDPLRVDVTGTTTQPISASALPLPTGAATSAKQPSLGTAGTPSSNVITVQGIASMTALKVDGSGVTQPVSGTVTANAGTGTFAVSVATVPSHDVTNAGTFAVQAAVADGADVTLGAKADAKSTATDTTPISVMSVLKQISASVQAPPSQAVTGTVTANAGTNLNTSALALETGGNLATIAGTVTAGIQQCNTAKINNVTPLMGNGVTGTGSQRVTVASDNTPFGVIAAGDVASGATDSGNPIKIGGRAATTIPTAVTDGQRANIMVDKIGRQIVAVGMPRGFKASGNITLTSTTETTLIGQVASTFLDLTKVIAVNTSATAVRVDFRDTTGGSVMFQLYIPAGQTVGFACGDDPIPQTTVNTNWTAQLSGAVTDVRIFASANKNI